MRYVAIKGEFLESKRQTFKNSWRGGGGAGHNSVLRALLHLRLRVIYVYKRGVEIRGIAGWIHPPIYCCCAGCYRAPAEFLIFLFPRLFLFPVRFRDRSSAPASITPRLRPSRGHLGEELFIGQVSPRVTYVATIELRSLNGQRRKYKFPNGGAEVQCLQRAFEMHVITNGGRRTALLVIYDITRPACLMYFMWICQITWACAPPWRDRSPSISRDSASPLFVLPFFCHLFCSYKYFYIL